MTSTIQMPFGGYDHDSLQYHFFCEGVVGACRLFRSNSIEHASMWVYENEILREVASSSGPIHAHSDTSLDAEAGNLRFRADGAATEIEVARGTETTRLLFKPRYESVWGDTISDVIHQPDMEVELEVGGVHRAGRGYCKRYIWTPAPHYWGYRFVQGFAEDDTTSIWTAEATFGAAKYDYFRMLMPDGVCLTANDGVSGHRQDAVFARTDRGDFHLDLKELGAWEATLQSGRMDSLLRQRICRFNARHGAQNLQGFAINETCYGTLG